MRERLDSWKAIARYLGREVRTVQRWAKARNLPVHRLPCGTRPRVFALTSELDAWLRSSDLESRPVSVAILPFVNRAGDAAYELFGDGLADDVINELVRIPGLRVIARTSSFAAAAGGARDVCEIGAQFGAAWVLEGSVRRDGQRVRVSAQLVNSRDGSHAWSERYDRDITDPFAIQDEIARAIAQALRLTLTPRNGTTRTTDLVAYDLWVRGRTLSQQFTLQAFTNSRSCYEAAILRDPAFAKPYFGLADLLFCAAEFGITEPAAVVPRAREAITRALELDGHFGEAHAVLGIFRGLLDHDWPGAEAAFRRALELSPGSASVLDRHAWYYLVPRMQVAEALREAHEAVALDPLSPFAHGHLGLVLVVARRYDRACVAFRTALELAPSLWYLRWFYATALLLKGEVDNGLREAWQVYGAMHGPVVVGAMAWASGRYGQPGKARELLRELEDLATSSRVPPSAFALAYLGLGDDRAFEWLNRAITAHDPVVTHLPSMPVYDDIRGDPRFPALLARMGLTQGAA